MNNMKHYKDQNGDYHWILPDAEPGIGWEELTIPEPGTFFPDPDFVPPYNALRANAYPSITDQLDMLWHMMDNEIIPGKDSPWYNTILSVKEEYPKPE